jgi:hypothetical protein
MSNKIHLPFSINSLPETLLNLVPSIEFCKLLKELNLFQTEDSKTIFAWFKDHPVGNPKVLNFTSHYGNLEYTFAYPAPTLEELLKFIIHKTNWEEQGFQILDMTQRINNILWDEIPVEKAAIFLLELTKSSISID